MVRSDVGQFFALDTAIVAVNSFQKRNRHLLKPDIVLLSLQGAVGLVNRLLDQLARPVVVEDMGARFSQCSLLVEPVPGFAHPLPQS